MFVFFLVILVIVLSLTYTYTNGFQDGSSVTATAIGSRALEPIQAVMVAASCEFLGALFGGSSVANAIQSITSWPARTDFLPVIISGLVAAIAWNFTTKKFKLPSSSTHALIGGIVGGVIAGTNSFKYIVWGDLTSLDHATGVAKAALSLVVSPVAGFLAGYIMLSLVLLLLARASTRINPAIKSLQYLTLSALSFGHGANDTQKAMGVILLALNASHLSNSYTIPLWVRAITGIAMAFGIASMVPGIVKKVGSGIYRLRPVHALTAQIASSGILISASMTGGPVSATQVISSAVMGVGTADRKKGVHWLIAKDMFVAWFLTIPCSALLAYLIYNIAGHWLNVGLQT